MLGFNGSDPDSIRLSPDQDFILESLPDWLGGTRPTVLGQNPYSGAIMVQLDEGMAPAGWSEQAWIVVTTTGRASVWDAGEYRRRYLRKTDAAYVARWAMAAGVS